MREQGLIAIQPRRYRVTTITDDADAYPPDLLGRLHLSVKTVRNVVSVVLGKLQAADRTEAALRARDVGMGAVDGAVPGGFPDSP